MSPAASEAKAYPSGPFAWSRESPAAAPASLVDPRRLVPCPEAAVQSYLGAHPAAASASQEVDPQRFVPCPVEALRSY